MCWLELLCMAKLLSTQPATAPALCQLLKLSLLCCATILSHSDHAPTTCHLSPCPCCHPAALTLLAAAAAAGWWIGGQLITLTHCTRPPTLSSAAPDLQAPSC